MAVCEISGTIEGPDGRPLASANGVLRLIADATRSGGAGSAGGSVVVWQRRIATDANGRPVDSDGGILRLRPNSGTSQDVIQPSGTYYELEFAGTRAAFVVPDETGPRNIGELVVPSPPVPSGLPVDHGVLAGLSDDDHTQYLLLDGSRKMTGDLQTGGNNIFTDNGDIDLRDRTPGVYQGGRVMGATQIMAQSYAPGIEGDVRLDGAARVLKLRAAPTDLDPNAIEVNIGLWPFADGEAVVLERHTALGAIRSRLAVTMVTSEKTLSVLDLDSLQIVDAASAVTVTVPDDATLAGPLILIRDGLVVRILQKGAGQATVAAGSGVTLLVPPGKTAATAGQGAMVTLVRVAASTWAVTGDLAETSSGGATWGAPIVPGKWVNQSWGRDAGSGSPGLDRLILSATIVEGGQVDAIGIEHVSAATPGSVCRLGIYSDNGGLPGSLIVEAGTVDLSTSETFKSVTLSPAVTLPAGRVWLAFCIQGASGPSVRCWAGGTNSYPLPLDTAGYETGAFYVSGISGSFPDPAPSPTGTQYAPIVWIRGA